MTDAEANVEAVVETRWQELETTCSEVIELSEAIARQLRDGAPTHQVVELLREQSRLAANLRDGIDAGLATTARGQGQNRKKMQ